MVRLLVKSHWPPFIFDNCECGGAAIPKQWPCPLHLSLSSSPLTVLFTSHCPLHLSLSSSPLTVLFTSHCPLHLSLSSSPLTVLFTSHCPLHLSLSSSPLTVLFTSHCPLHLSLSSSPLTVLFTSHCPLHLSLSSSPLTDAGRQYLVYSDDVFVSVPLPARSAPPGGRRLLSRHGARRLRHTRHTRHTSHTRHTRHTEAASSHPHTPGGAVRQTICTEVHRIRSADGADKLGRVSALVCVLLSYQW